MANKQATVKWTLRGDVGIHPAAAEILAIDWAAENAGEVDIADQTAGSTVVTIPFGAIGTEATCFWLKNTTNQDLTLKVSGANNGFRMPPGSTIIYATPVAAGGSTKLTAATVTTTATMDGAQVVTFGILGDPV